MSRIPESVVRTILERADILKVVGERVRLEKKGGRYWGLCPFHAEKSPSFSVDPDKRFFFCFGCRKGGDVVTFLRELEKLSYREALEELASSSGVPLELEEEESEEERHKKALAELNDRLVKTFHYFLVEKESGDSGREVLRKRAIPDSIRDEFRLGYAPPDRSWLKRFLLGKGYSSAFLAKAGLFSERYPDFPLFSDRLIFPIADYRGKMLAFGGRLLQGEGPKYLNSPDTALFHKQENLFALDKALDSIKKTSEIIICEGYMDALSFHAAGMRNAVAPLGTAFTDRQAKLVRRWAERIIFAFDSDEAGQKAAERSVVLAVREGLEARVALLPGGKDASEILEKEGPGSLQKLQNFTINGGEFLVGRAKRLFDIGSVEGKAKAAAFLNSYIEALSSEIMRGAFFDLASRELGIRTSHYLSADFNESRKRGEDSRRVREEGAPEAASEPRRNPDFLFMAAVAVHEDLFPALRSELSLESLDNPRAREIYIALEECFRADERGLDSLIKRLPDEGISRFLLEAAASGEFSENPQKMLDDGLHRIRLRDVERRRDRVLSLLSEGGSEERPIQDLLYEKMYLDEELARLKSERDERS